MILFFVGRPTLHRWTGLAAGDDSDYVNGASLVIVGGITLFPGFSTNG